MATPSAPPPAAPGFATSPPPPRDFDQPETVGRYLRGGLVALSIIAAAIHFAFAPDHFSEDWRHGFFFLVSGWAQVAWAVLLLVRPRRWVLSTGIIGNALIIAVWAVSRTSGLPTWLGGNGEAEAVGNADLLCSVVEALIVIGSAALLAMPELARKAIGDVRIASAAAASVITLAIVGASVGINPSTSGHSHAGAGHHGDSHASETAVGDASHDAAHDAAHDGSHDASHDAASGAAATGSAHAAHGVAVPWESGKSPCELATKDQSPEDQPANEGHNHHGPLPQKPISNEDRRTLIDQQKQARSVIDKYPNVAAAEADGYRKSTTYIPCIGAHYTKVSLVGSFNPAAPSELLFDGDTPDAKIIGLSYLILHPGGMPDGFAGPNDVWHQHSSNGGLCLNRQGVVVGGEATSVAECTRRGGVKNGLKDIWMVHDWVAPGWDCSWGVFAAECPELGGKVGGTAED